ncbi:hypothetical protein SAMN05216234_12926 [Hydrogenimonas thermophila]|uniref:Uncharacterized protein n=1 Tax=Hydrogenimonas thermophila TaxID=223786 RepID=A0A1I5RY19_9BACT|nr:hypothetical protein SAMN05216234_12926 [Hydrogenimonas thermophila]
MRKKKASLFAFLVYYEFLECILAYKNSVYRFKKGILNAF